ncbi:MAG: hypothetical protein GY810_23515 [Aureispira sp.]|nr:hypothetical protein [Aureispira sp.]
MIKNLITLVVVFVIGWLAYTQFFGTDKEKEQGRALIGSAKQTFGIVVDIFKSEGEKFQNGTYDDAINKLGKVLDDLRSADKKGDYQDRIAQLVTEKKRLEEKLKPEETPDGPKERSLVPENKQTEDDLKKLTDEVNQLLEDMDKNVK